MHFSARDKIIHAARVCFAEKGYASTSIVDIEEAAGLAVGSGATYRHFKSKEEILEAVVNAALAQLDEDLEPANTSMVDSAHQGVDLLRRDQDLLRVLFRDLGAFPELRRRVLDRMMPSTFGVVAERTGMVSPNGDAEALAVVIGGAMFNYGVMELVLGVQPLGVSQERFAHALGRMVELLIADEWPDYQPETNQ